ncbi:hypothetical protein D3C81_1244910 [compost metagenome]
MAWYVEAGYGDDVAFAAFSARMGAMTIEKDHDLAATFPALHSTAPHIIFKDVNA